METSKAGACLGDSRLGMMELEAVRPKDGNSEWMLSSEWMLGVATMVGEALVVQRRVANQKGLRMRGVEGA